MSTSASRRFFKLCGSGNDFVFFDVRDELPGALAEARLIQLLCARATGVGADGVVFVHAGISGGSIRIVYHNSDGTRASLCGNATLCAARLAVALGAADPAGFAIETDAGLVAARLRDGTPEIDLQPVAELSASVAAIAPAGMERRIGFARVGVPHLVVLVDSVDEVELDARGSVLRHHPSLPDGANVNFVSRAGPEAWRMRTFERGVEGETLACGTGAVASAALLGLWIGGAMPSAAPTRIMTRSGRELVVSGAASAGRRPSLRGEGRIVFEGRLAELF